MTFELRVVYTAPSKETVFLGAGWEPARDVRGAFISEPVGELLIERRALSGSHASQLALTFSMATRAAVDAMVVRASGMFGSSHVIVQKSLKTWSSRRLLPIRPERLCGSHCNLPLVRVTQLKNRRKRWISSPWMRLR